MSELVKRYTFAEVAKREGAECTTTITTTQEEKYVLASDHERAMAEKEAERVAYINECAVYHNEVNAEHAAEIAAKDAELSEAHGVAQACEIRAEKAEARVKVLEDTIMELLSDWDIAFGPGACDGPEGSRTRARAALAGKEVGK